MATRSEYFPYYGKLDTDRLHSSVRTIWYSKDRELEPVESYQLCDREWQDTQGIDQRLDNAVVVNMLMDKLTKREQQIMYMHHVLEMTLDEIGQTQNVTRERIRQIELTAIRKCKYWTRQEAIFQKAMREHRELTKELNEQLAISPR